MVRKRKQAGIIRQYALEVTHKIKKNLGGIIQSIQDVHMLTDPQMPGNREFTEDIGVNTDAMHSCLIRCGVLEFPTDICAAGGQTSIIVANGLRFSRARSEIRKSVNLAQVLDQAIESTTSKGAKFISRIPLPNG